MKLLKTLGICSVFLILAYLINASGITVVFAQQPQTEKIQHFATTVHVNPDASIDVRETITYDFAGNSRHGIYRDIPTSYRTTLGNASIKLSDISVEDAEGIASTFTLSYLRGYTRIKIGDQNILVKGIKTYVIKYHVDRAIDYYKDFDELYWNATGNEWQIPIDSAEATIIFPQVISKDDVKISCYEGELGSTNTCNYSLNKNTSTQEVESVHFTSKASYKPYEGMTVAVGFPKGIVREPTQTENILQVIKDNWVIGLPIIVFILMFLLWFKKGKDPKGTGTIVAQYDAPDKLNPLEISAILHQGARNNDISAEIIYLATKGFIKITRIEVKGFIFSSTDYTLTKLKNGEEAESEIDRVLLESVFGTDQEIKISSLTNVFYKKLPKIKKATINAVIAKGYYLADPQKTSLKYGWVIIFCFILFAVFVISGHLTILAMFSMVLSVIIIIIFAAIMPKVTKQGALAREHMQGLKQYITVAEIDRIKFHNAPEKSPQLFETLLPFAMVLGVESAWAKQFETLYLTPPSWYNDSSGRAFNAVLFTNNLHAFSTAASSSFTSSPRSSSGSGGGGFSGGGGGGGGGGSW